jgi:hypothetical protein
MRRIERDKTGNAKQGMYWHTKSTPVLPVCNRLLLVLWEKYSFERNNLIYKAGTRW